MGSWKDIKEVKKVPVVESKPLDLKALEKKVDNMVQVDPVTQRQKEDKPIKTKKKIRKNKAHIDITNLITGVIFAMVFYLLISAYLYLPDPEMGAVYFIVVIIVGMFCWLPLGIPLGAILIDTYLRCRVLRFVNPKRNYGVIHIVSKGHYIVTMIRDLNESIIMKDEAIWGISKGYVYNFNKKARHEIGTEHINYISNVPVLYLDYESMKPLTFHQEQTTISPKQLGSSLVGWAMVQKKKAIRSQKSVNYMYLIISVLIIINIGLTGYIYMLLSQIMQGG